jgi:N-methylhydantoinase A
VLLRVPPGVERGTRSAPEFRRFLHSLERLFAQLEQRGREELRKEQFSPAKARAEWRLDMRYAGQAYELSIPFSAEFARQFHHEHEKAYGYAHAARPLEIVNLRVRLVIATAKPPNRPERRARAPNTRPALVKHGAVWFGRRPYSTPFYERERLRAGARLAGPAVVVEYSSTTVVPPGFVCRVDNCLDLVLSPR